MHEQPDWMMCPRCEAGLFIGGKGAVSRTSRDGGADIMVCPRCGEREAVSGYDPADQVPFTAWPVEIEQLLRDEEALIRRYRASSFQMLDIADIDPGDDGEDDNAQSTPSGLVAPLPSSQDCSASPSTRCT